MGYLHLLTWLPAATARSFSPRATSARNTCMNSKALKFDIKKALWNRVSQETSSKFVFTLYTQTWCVLTCTRNLCTAKLPQWGLFQTTNFSCSESNANEQKLLFWLWNVRRLIMKGTSSTQLVLINYIAVHHKLSAPSKRKVSVGGHCGFSNMRFTKLFYWRIVNEEKQILWKVGNY